MRVHESHAGGGTNILFVDDVLYIMERTGAGAQPGLVFALNNLGGELKMSVKTVFLNSVLRPLAWRGKDSALTPQAVTTDGDGWCEVEVPQRGYVVYGV